MLKFTNIAACLLLSAAALPASALAQAPAAPAIDVGATVYGPQGAEVGKIEKVDGDIIVVNTGTSSASLQSSAFGVNAKGLTIGFTKAQLEQAIAAAAQAAQDKLAAALVPGAAVVTADGQPLGAVKSIGDDGMVLIDREAGAFALPKTTFAVEGTGLKISMTQAQVDEALSTATSAAPETTKTAE